MHSDWKTLTLDSTQKVAEAVYEIFSTFVGKKLDYDVIVNNDTNKGHPLAHYEKNNNCWEITLSCASGTHWSQIAYQLAHEICHLYCNHSLCREHKHKWFEESLCECASIAILKKLSEEWDTHEISSYNKNYAESMDSYINDVKDSVAIKFDNSERFIKWLNSNISELEQSSTNRELNKVVAVFLFDSILSDSSCNWLATTTLNLWNCFDDNDFNSFIDNWLKNSTSNINEVRNITNLLKG